ncbi:unnamed protein product [Blepharisma stoltei]|uniref:AAA+ ATPase domain-containing protein n=1 Tax=Blepharisma stoltei TaxID=1481888 RepID=A0AAU9IC80_9CILI|nr:unnamed protein product [Blepharisma stoltei]
MNKHPGMKCRTDIVHEAYYEHLKSKYTTDLEEVTQEIDTWLTKNNIFSHESAQKSLPLMICGNSGSGKSTLIAQWIDLHEKSHKRDNDFLLYHFVKISASDREYYFTLFRLYNKIREAYQIPKRVGLIEDDLRIYFSRWLETAAERRALTNSVKQNLILVIDGVDKYLDQHGREEPSDWLPCNLPAGVKMIFTCNNDSKSYPFLEKKVSYIIELKPLTSEQRLDIFNEHLLGRTRDETPRILDKLQQDIKAYDCFGNPLYLNLMLSLSMHCVHGIDDFEYESLENMSTPEKLFEYSIDFYSQRHFKEEIMLRIFGLLTVTRSGLSEEELIKLSNCKPQQVSRILTIFHTCLVCISGFYIFSNECFKKVVLEKLGTLSSLHHEISRVLEGNKLTIRKTDELLYHLEASNSWMKLKDQLTKLDVFTLMMTPDYKLDLFNYWAQLEQQRFDPVQEYNKTIEEFVAQHSPSHHDLLILMLQFCRFFKEYNDMEVPSAFNFRHPHLKGYYELKEINLLEEVEKLPEMFFSTQQYPLKEEENFSIENKMSRLALKEMCLKAAKKEYFNTKPPNFYYYKRWLWIQFPWCTLDSNADFSQIMRKFNDENEMMNPKAENDLSIEMLSIFKNANAKAIKKYTPVTRSASSTKIEISKKRHTRNESNTQISRAVGILPKIRSQMTLGLQTPESKSRSHSVSSLQHSFTSNCFSKSFTVKESFDVEFKDLSPDNVLEKIGSSLYEYSNAQVNNKRRENFEMKKFYNRLIEETRIKKLKLIGIKSQLEKNEDNFREQCEIKQKIDELQKQMESILDKLNNAELDSRRLECIISCCFKNPARNDEWVRGLEKGIENMKDMIKFELGEIKNCNKETEMLEEQYYAYKATQKDKAMYQHDTIERILSQYQIKNRINETLSKGEKKRKDLVTKIMSEQSNSYFFDKIKQRNKLKVTISDKMQYLKGKLEHYNQVMSKVSKVLNISHPRELGMILFTFEKSKELKESIKVKETKIQELKCERDLLLSKLQIFRKKETENDKNQKIAYTLDELHDKVRVAEQRFEHLHKLSKRQEYLYISCLGSLEQLWGRFAVEKNYDIDSTNIKKVISTLDNRICEMKNKLGDSFRLRIKSVNEFPISKSSERSIIENHDVLDVKEVSHFERKGERKNTKLLRYMSMQ